MPRPGNTQRAMDGVRPIRLLTHPHLSQTPLLQSLTPDLQYSSDSAHLGLLRAHGSHWLRLRSQAPKSHSRGELGPTLWEAQEAGAERGDRTSCSHPSPLHASGTASQQLLPIRTPAYPRQAAWRPCPLKALVRPERSHPGDRPVISRRDGVLSPSSRAPRLSFHLQSMRSEGELV